MGFRIPSLIDIITFIINIVYIYAGLIIAIKIIWSLLKKNSTTNKRKNNIIIAAFPSILLGILSFGSIVVSFITNIFFANIPSHISITDIVSSFFSFSLMLIIYGGIVTLLGYIILSITDVILISKQKIKYLLVGIFLLLLFALYPKTNDTWLYQESTQELPNPPPQHHYCQCIGINTIKVYGEKSACFGILMACKTIEDRSACNLGPSHNDCPVHINLSPYLD